MDFLDIFFKTLLGTGFIGYLAWLGIKLVSIAQNLDRLRVTMVGENGDDGVKVEVTKLRKWRHEISQTIQEHELRLDAHDGRFDKLEKA